MNPTEKTGNLPAIQTQNNMMPSQQEFQMLQVIAKNAQDSGLYSGVGQQQAKIFMVLLAARELGISPMLALNGGIWNIQGKIEISARLMNSMIRRAGHIMEVKKSPTECIIKGKRCDTGEEYTETFTWAMAEKAGLSNGNVWKKYPEDMLYNRCMSRLARTLFPDVIGTAYVEGEIRESKDIEKLERAECEEITHDTKKSHSQSDVNLSQEGKISFDQLTEIMIGYAKTDDIFKKNLKAYIDTKYNVQEFEDLPAKLFEPIMTSIKRNIELQTQETK